LLGRSIHIKGRVQGVGFRPFVYRLAVQLQLAGWVKNGPDGVHILIAGDEESMDRFENHLRIKPPALSIITSFTSELEKVNDLAIFQIIESAASGPGEVLLTPDLALCMECRHELHDPLNRRYHYPFITCTQCGPRYSIIQSLPYDRPGTTMSPFTMCPTCQSEYNDPLDPRHHAQTNSCPDCAILQSWCDATGNVLHQNQTVAVNSAVQALLSGFIVAVKGVGGYLLMGDATQARVIEQLRERKHRPSKPFAVLYGDKSQLELDVLLSDLAWKQLTSPESPIVLLPFRSDEPDSGLQRNLVAPGLDQLGVMWPYTPLLDLISKEAGRPLIATSGNKSGSPIFYQDEKAIAGLEGIADFFLVNNRTIVVPQDDSVMRYSPVYRQPVILRRSRGFAPSLILPSSQPMQDGVLAMGAALKSTFAFTHRNNCYVSQYLGDTDHYEVQQAYEHTLDHLLRTTGQEPRVILVDRHPQYASTLLGQRLAEELSLPILKVQHHEAHFMAVLEEHSLCDREFPILGFIWDGTGYGHDGQTWGSECFMYQKGKLRRAGHLNYVAHLAGDQMARDARLPALAFSGGNPTILAYLETKFSRSAWNIYQKLLENDSKIQTSSMGRLFDAAGCLLELGTHQSFEGEIAMKLEAQAWEGIRRIGWELEPYGVLRWDGAELLMALFHDKSAVPERAARFHRTLIGWMFDEAGMHPEVEHLAMSGGVWQNGLLVDMALHFKPSQYNLYFHKQLSPNDEGISFGQLVHYQKVGQQGFVRDQLMKAFDASTSSN